MSENGTICEVGKRDVPECLEARSGLGQGCVTPPWQFNIFADKMGVKVNL